MNTYQCQPISTLVVVSVLSDIPIWQPWTHDAKWKRRLGNLNNGEYVRVRIDLSPFNRKVVYLVQSVLSTSLKNKGSHVHFLFSSGELGSVCESP